MNDVVFNVHQQNLTVLGYEKNTDNSPIEPFENQNSFSVTVLSDDDENKTCVEFDYSINLSAQLDHLDKANIRTRGVCERYHNNTAYNKISVSSFTGSHMVSFSKDEASANPSFPGGGGLPLQFPVSGTIVESLSDLSKGDAVVRTRVILTDNTASKIFVYMFNCTVTYEWRTVETNMQTKSLSI